MKFRVLKLTIIVYIKLSYTYYKNLISRVNNIFSINLIILTTKKVVVVYPLKIPEVKQVRILLIILIKLKFSV